MRRTATVVILTVLAAGCGSATSTRHSSTAPGSMLGPSVSKSQTAAAPARSPNLNEGATAGAFASAYVRFLDGELGAGGLPDASAKVRALAARAGAIPPGKRRGTLMLVQLHPAAGVKGQYLLAARDAAHTVYAQLEVGVVAGQWTVSNLVPPDFVQSFAGPGPPAPAPPPGSAAAEGAARAFLSGYLPWLYGHGPLAAVRDASQALLTRLKANPPRIPPTMIALHASVVALGMQRDGPGWQALPNITDGEQSYELVLSVRRVKSRWLVSNIGSPN